VKHKTNYIIAIEYKEYDNDYPNDFVTQLINREICSVKNNKIKFKVTGFIIYKNTFIIIFPKNYNVPREEKDLLKHAQVLFQVLLKYKQESNLNVEEMELLGGEDGQYKESYYTSYLIISDFIENGPLKKEIRIESSSYSGRIDWSATINKKQPIFSKGSVIYNDTVSKKNMIDHHHLLLQIYRYCVNKSIEKYGWLFDLSLENVEEFLELPCDINYGINFLTKELNSTFVDREMKVVKILRDFLSGIEFDRFEKIEIMVTPYFHNVWEVICSFNFKNQYKGLRSLIPKTKWEIESSAKVQSQRPDIIFIKEKTIYILDAKYYDIDTNLPGWSDIVKQFFYGFTIFRNINAKMHQRIKQLETVENSFLFPSGDPDPIKYVGRVSIEENMDLGYIKAYKINTFLAMQCYLGKERFDFINQMISKS